MIATRRVALLLSVCCLTAHAATAETLIASNYTNGWVPSGFRTDVGYMANTGSRFVNTSEAQRFTPTASGFVTAVELAIRNNSATTPLLVSLHEDAAGEPGTSFGQVSVPSSDVPGAYFMLPAGTPLIRTRVDMTSLMAPLNAGTAYHLVLSTATAKNAGQYSSHLMDPHAASYGFEYQQDDGGGSGWGPTAFDLEMPVAVFAIIPEPATVWLALIIAGGVASRLRRRGSAQRGSGQGVFLLGLGQRSL